MKAISQTKPLMDLPLDVNSYFGQDSIEKAAELYKEMEMPILGAVDLDIDVRMLGHWVKKLDNGTELNNRKKYSFTEFVFLKIVEQLRLAGLNFSTIALLKNNLLDEIKLKGIVTKLQHAQNYIEDLKVTKEQKEHFRKLLASIDTTDINEATTFTLLHIIIMECLLKKLPLSIAVFLDGTFLIIDKSKEHLYSENDKTKLLFETHIVISVSTILKKFLHSDLSGFVVPELGLLSYSENKLFEVVHSGEYDSILVTFKDKKIKSLELKKSEDIKQRIIDILDKGAFGEIVVKKHKGIVTKIENTIKVTL